MNGKGSTVAMRQIALHVKGVIPPGVAILHLHVEEHLGGNRYRQAHRIRPINNDAAFVGLIPTAVYRLNIYHVPFCRLCAPDSFLYTTLPRRLMTKNLDRLARIGALWQYLARVAVGKEMGLPNAVPNVYATFYDQNLLAFGTIEEWVGGRPWRLEMDDRLFERVVPRQPVDYLHPQNFANEYTAKRFFLARIERVLREMGASGLAMRYAWSNWLSSRRVVLRADTDDVYRGLTAVDFEPALGDAEQLQAYVERHAEWFASASMAVQELLTLLRDLSSLQKSAHVMPRANPGVASLLWYWSSPRKPHGFAGYLNAVRERWLRRIHITVRLARNPSLRTAWLLEKVEEGLQAGQLSESEAAKIREQATDIYVQIYLHSLFIHMCMLPVTPAVVLLIGAIYAHAHGLSFIAGVRLVAAWLAIFAVVPMSPGSLARGLYVVWLAVQRKMVRRLKVALVVSFWRYVGYLAFPLQMATTFPALSRYMAARWATDAVRLIPYYGEPGGRLEHIVFDLFFNLPLSLARRRQDRQASRQADDANGTPPTMP